MRTVPRYTRAVEETPQAEALEATVREFDRAQARLKALREQLQRDVIAAVQAGMSKAEAARRTGYSREHVSRLVSEAEGRSAPGVVES